MHTEAARNFLEYVSRTDEYPVGTAPLQPFPPMPTIRATVLSRKTVRQQWPAFDGQLTILTQSCAESGHSPRMAGLIAPRSVLGGQACFSAQMGHALVLNLPGAFEPCLAGLVQQKPKLFNLDSLNRMSSETLYGWHCILPDGRPFCLMVPDNTLQNSDLLRIHNADYTEDRVVFVPVVMVAGNSVASGGFWYDADDELEGQGAAMSSNNYRPYRLWDAATREASARQAEQVGSSTPWVIRPWRDEQGIYLMQFAILQYRRQRPNEDRAE